MCCLLALAALIGPRIATVAWYLLDPSRWVAVFQGAWLWPVLGAVLVPWTTLVYVLLAPAGGIEGVGGIGLLLLIIAVVVDLGSYGGGVRTRQ
jgi:hypothetical protein